MAMQWKLVFRACKIGKRHASDQVHCYSYCKVDRSEIIIALEGKDPCSRCFPNLRQCGVRQKGRGDLIRLQRTVLPLSDTLEYVSMYTISIPLDRNDGGILT